MKNEARSQCITAVMEIINRQEKFSSKVLNKQYIHIQYVYRGYKYIGQSRVSIIPCKIDIALFPVHYLCLQLSPASRIHSLPSTRSTRVHCLAHTFIND